MGFEPSARLGAGGTAVLLRLCPALGKVGLRLGGLAVETVGLKVTCRLGLGVVGVGRGDEGSVCWMRGLVSEDGPEDAIAVEGEAVQASKPACEYRQCEGSV